MQYNNLNKYSLWWKIYARFEEDYIMYIVNDEHSFVVEFDVMTKKEDYRRNQAICVGTLKNIVE